MAPDMAAPLSPRQQYVAWIEERVEDYKSALSRDELLSIAEDAVDGLFHTHDGQYPLTEILLRDAVDGLIFERLRLPTYRQWLRTCRMDTPDRPEMGTVDEADEVGEVG
jgi:hypothetical protein